MSRVENYDFSEVSFVLEMRVILDTSFGAFRGRPRLGTSSDWLPRRRGSVHVSMHVWDSGGSLIRVWG